jgi:hypothetical protein
VYLAAHMLKMRLNAQKDYTSGVSTGVVRSISVQDRSVTYDTGSQSAVTKVGLAQTFYGQEYLTMLRRHPVFLLRA